MNTNTTNLSELHELKEFLLAEDITDAKLIEGKIDEYIEDRHTRRLLEFVLQTNILQHFMKRTRLQGDVVFQKKQKKKLIKDIIISPEDADKAILYSRYLAHHIGKKEFENLEENRLEELKVLAKTKSKKQKATKIDESDKEEKTSKSELISTKNTGTKNSVSAIPQQKNKKQRGFVWYSFWLLFFGAGTWFGYGAYQDFIAEKIYVVGYPSLRMWPEKNESVEENIVAKIPYGKRVPVYSSDEEWAHVRYNFQKGYAKLEYLIDEKSYWKINSIYANGLARNDIGELPYRLALKDYFDSKDYMGKIPTEVQKEIYGENYSKERQIWQLNAYEGDKIKTIQKLNLTGSVYKDFACIIEREGTNEKELLVFSFDKDGNPIEPSPIFSERNFDSTNGIQAVLRGSRRRAWYIGNKKSNGGKREDWIDNRDAFYYTMKKDGNEKEVLVIFKGGQFKKYEQ